MHTDPQPHPQPALAANTTATYCGQWRRFATWAMNQGVRALPADPGHVAAYLTERLEREGHTPATLRAAASAIAAVHRAAGLDSPCATPEVRQTLRGATRQAGRRPKPATALTATALARIQATAAAPRRGRGGHRESRAVAQRRAGLDVALISLMRDALLRVSDAAALTWADLGVAGDGTGRLRLRRATPDPEGAESLAFVSVPTMARLAALRQGAGPGDRIFGLGRNQLATRIKQAARAAGLGDAFSGHSPRLGMARDLASAGLDRPRPMTAERGRPPDRPSSDHHTETEGTDAVAQFYARRRHPA